MFSIKNLFIITKKEFRSYFNNPTAYIVMVVFLLLWEFLFFRSAIIVGEASLRILFDYLPWLFILLISAITMGSISQENGEGTLEFLLTHPLRDMELLTGKFTGSLIFVSITLLFIFPVAAGFSMFGNLDWGMVIGQYLGSLFFAAALISLGIFVSSLFASQISSLLVTATLSFLFVIAGSPLITMGFPSFLVPLLDRLSILSHFESMARGVIDLRDIWYFLSAVIMFLSLAYIQLIKRRFGNQRSLYRRYKTGIGLFIGIAILTNAVGEYIPGRADLTQNRLYTITEATRRTLTSLNDIVNITLFASAELPAQLQPVLRDTNDIIRDYKTIGKGNILINYKNPSVDSQYAQEAISLGIREVQFNVVGRGELQLKRGYLGLAVSYGGKNESIPFIQDTADLEYKLTSFIKKLTTKEKKKIGFLSGHGEKSLSREYKVIKGELEKQFEVKEITIDEAKPAIGENISIIIIAGPSQKIDEKSRKAIKDYLDSGGSGVFLIDALTVNPQMLMTSLNEESFSDFLKEYGVEVSQDVVYDIRSNETVRFGGGLVDYYLPYPFWARVIPHDRNSPITAKIEGVVLPWASSIKLDESKAKEAGFNISRFLSTTRFGGTLTGKVSLTPSQKLPTENLSGQVASVGLIREQHEGNGNKMTRIVVVGDSDFLSDQFVNISPMNLAFGINIFSWLGQEESLAAIKIKQRVERRLLFENETQITLVKYGNMAIALLIPLIYGSIRLIRRRGLQKFTYEMQI